MGPVVELQALQAGETLAALGAVVGLQVLVGPQMTAQAAQQLEAFTAGRTLMRLPVGVSHLVDFQTLSIGEGLLALGAGHQLLLLVLQDVTVEALVRHKHLVAHFAVVALLPLVHLQMLRELTTLAETVPTEAALEGFRPRVRPVVRLPVPPQSEGLVTVEALVGLPAVVDLLVDDEAQQGRVVLTTLPTLVWFLALVDPPVSLQVGQLIETLLTFGAVDHLSAQVGGGRLLLCPEAEIRVVVCKRSRYKSVRKLIYDVRHHNLIQT